ncbi:3-ketosteroid-9-alpha-monooxygenase, oxygenase component [Acaryochloris thomasi RCC1774]|uniref:3-ketosteroid-9-alpha-monooxygenase, oxygenase component n=1 Tax=Acaryochloris thomasi RCC1774 TaxID=1764569 RepID=A0A2W1JL98_9CYAN|nr:Rieske 2Fe-2S domain-containing protein [Acaryochloris thomasi]PZD74138.1 3-ketosteroid-9-alpha-monooxygenase, oxygenase component [Acaryochloris thomasi RCC1774]
MSLAEARSVEVSSENEQEVFQWTKQWYPLAVTELLDPKKPHAVQLLGKDLVLWRDGDKQWHCFEDACPHRLVPLSEGRVEDDGTLLCAYHAWRFDGAGNCVSIPQSKDAATEEKHKANPKACAIAYPTQERQGLLWIWAESGAEAYLESQMREPRIIPELEDDSGRVKKLFWYVRDLPYGWDSFIENVIDPAHVTVSHHGIMGKREDARYVEMSRVKEVSAQEGLSFKVGPTPDVIAQTVQDFQPPCLVHIGSQYKDGGKFILALYASPTRPGWCRQVGCQVLVKNEAGQLPSGLGFYGLPMPQWLGHALTSLFMHQDLVFLHYQEKIIARRSEEWLDQVYTPNPQDKAIIAFRKWLQYKAGGGIPWACDPELPPAERDKQVLFDVWSTHTKDCQVCRQALKNIQRVTVVAYVAAIICFGVGILVDARAIRATSQLWVMPSVGFWVAIASSILLAGGGYLLQKFSRLFYVYEFEHAHND